MRPPGVFTRPDRRIGFLPVPGREIWPFLAAPELDALADAFLDRQPRQPMPARAAS